MKPSKTTLDLADEFRRNLIQQGLSQATITGYMVAVRGYLRHVGDDTSAEAASAYFATIKNKATRKVHAGAVSRFLRFAASRLPVPVVPVKRTRAAGRSGVLMKKK